MNTRARLEQLKFQQATDRKIAAEIARLEELLTNRPKEPPVDAVIAFNRMYEKSGRSYGWVAYQAVGGWWYLTQSNYNTRGMPRMRWDELLDFIDDNDIFIVTAWEQL